ncbi:MAG: MFS transporter [Lachnospiraceae bacterium]|nr:MFS transporter [Lachnospiraceae bacterium]
MKKNYKSTMYACFIGYIVQAIVNNFVPLLFVTFQNSYQIPLSKITLLITINFLIQLIIDLASAGFIDRLGYRFSVILAHICSASGLIALTILPEVFADPYTGILVAVAIYAVGGGLIEVLVSPIIEACPTDHKESAMSLLHSFYCWGHVGVVLISTIFFTIAGIANWKILTLIWAVIPVANMILFTRVPIYSLNEEGERGLNLKELFAKKIFWLLMLMMLCAGASEQAVSQWASTFAEKGLGVSKTVGDLAGPMSFAFLMGIARLIYGKYGERMNLERFMKFSTVLCIISYVCIAAVPYPVVGLIGCAVCGFSVGIMWPGTFSKASASIRNGGTAMFAMLALAGDVGCSGGPTLAGFVSSAFGNNLHVGICAALVFPVLMLCSLFVGRRA